MISLEDATIKITKQDVDKALKALDIVSSYVNNDKRLLSHLASSTGYLVESVETLRSYSTEYNTAWTYINMIERKIRRLTCNDYSNFKTFFDFYQKSLKGSCDSFEEYEKTLTLWGLPHNVEILN